MSNSKNSNLEDVSKGNDESAPGANDSTSNKRTRFTKSKFFRELEIDDSEEFSNDFDDDSVDEIIPIHNEYRDLDKSEALDDESVEGGIILNPDADDLAEANVNESTFEYEVDLENADSIGSETDSEEFDESLSVKTDFDESGESIDGVEDIDEEGFITDKNGDVLADEGIEEKIGKSSAQGVLINDKDKTSDSQKSLDIFSSSTIISIVGFIVGLAILLMGIIYYGSSSDRVVDNVLSGETAGLAIFLVIIGLIIIAFSLLKFFSSSKSSLIIDTFNSIKSIDYDDVSEDVISREDFDAVFSIFKRKKDSNFSDNDESVDSSKDLLEDDSKVSDDDISSLYSKSNLTSQKNQSSSKGQETANSTDISDDYDDDGVDEIIPIHSKLNEQSNESDLEDKYSKYDFDDEEFDLVVDDSIEGFVDDEGVDLVVDDSIEGSVEEDEFDLVVDEFTDESEPIAVVDDSLDDLDLAEENPIEEEIVNTQDIEDADSSLEVEKMGELDDKYSKYDFDDEEEEMEDSIYSKPKFKKSVDLSKFEEQPLTEDEFEEQKRIAHEKMLEKKRRIIEGTNFDNSLRKQ